MDSLQSDSRSVDGIILAAGLSQRAGRLKMALPLGDRAVIQRSVEGMLPFVEQLYVVVGWQAERVERLLTGYDKVVAVVNPDYLLGMFSSIRAGVAKIGAARFFLLPGDIAMVLPGVYRSLLEASGEVVIPTYHERRGHPILLSSALIPEILNAPEEATLRDVIRRHPPTAVAVNDDGILHDIDTPADYDAVLARANP